MDMDNDMLFQLFRFLGAQIPEMVVLFLGMVLAVAKWRQHPRPSLLAFLGFGTLLVVSIGGISALIFVPVFFPNGNHAHLMVGVWVGRSVLYATGFALLLGAIYVACHPRRLPPPFRPAVEETVNKLHATIDEVIAQLREPEVAPMKKGTSRQSDDANPAS